MRDPYFFLSVGVLENLLNITDGQKLAEVETDMVFLKLIDTNSMPVPAAYDVEYLQSLHRYLFEDIYPWAGEFRTINFIKEERILDGASVDYSDHTMIGKDLTRAITKLNQTEWQELQPSQQVHALVLSFAALWRVHPFREGNTRTITTFMLQFAADKGMPVDRALLAKYNAYVRDALVIASLGEYAQYEYLEKILREAMGIAEQNAPLDPTAEATAEKYQKIKGYDVRDYHYKSFEPKE